MVRGTAQPRVERPWEVRSPVVHPSDGPAHGPRGHGRHGSGRPAPPPPRGPPAPEPDAANTAPRDPRRHESRTDPRARKLVSRVLDTPSDPTISSATSGSPARLSGHRARARTGFAREERRGGAPSREETTDPLGPCGPDAAPTQECERTCPSTSGSSMSSSDSARRVAVDHIDLEVQDGEFFSLLGPSGCGKTTTLRMIGGFEEPTSGLIELQGEDVTWLPPFKRNVNTVFQNYALFPHLTIYENVAFGLRRKGVKDAEVKSRVAEMLELVELPGYERRKPTQICGGQAQRVALARALDQQARRPAARRTAGRARPEAAQADAGRAQAHPAGGRDHVHLRDPRPGRGDDDVRSHRGDEPGPLRAARRPREPLRAPDDPVRRRLPRHQQPAARRASEGTDGQYAAVQLADGTAVRVAERARRGPRSTSTSASGPRRSACANRPRSTRRPPGTTSCRGVVRDASYLGVSTQYQVEAHGGARLTVYEQNVERATARRAVGARRGGPARRGHPTTASSSRSQPRRPATTEGTAADRRGRQRPRRPEEESIDDRHRHAAPRGSDPSPASCRAAPSPARPRSWPPAARRRPAARRVAATAAASAAACASASASAAPGDAGQRAARSGSRTGSAISMSAEDGSSFPTLEKFTDRDRHHGRVRGRRDRRQRDVLRRRPAGARSRPACRPSGTSWSSPTGWSPASSGSGWLETIDTRLTPNFPANLPRTTRAGRSTPTRTSPRRGSRA